MMEVKWEESSVVLTKKECSQNIEEILPERQKWENVQGILSK